LPWRATRFNQPAAEIGVYQAMFGALDRLS
jgi:hypothetical protein